MNFFNSTFVIFITVLSNIELFGQSDDIAQSPSRSQIIDDSTKQIYGPLTSRYFYEDNVFFGDFKSHTIDTLIRDFHLYNFIQKLKYEYQDLGNIGTAMSPIFYRLPKHIGRTSGWSANNFYWELEPMRYFDTHSPYSNLGLVLGGKGRSLTHVVYSRNIKPNWNFGFNYKGIFIDKQIQRGGKGDRNVSSNYYDGFTTYHTKDSTYWVFFNFKRLRHIGYESGGVKEEQGNTTNFFSNLAQVHLTKAKNTDLRTNFHLFHQYTFSKKIQVYHKADQYRQYVTFTDNDLENEYYDATVVDSTNTYDSELFKTLHNELGLKGNAGIFFYSGYWAAREYTMDYRYIVPDDSLPRLRGLENYIGGQVRARLFSKATFSVSADYLMGSNYKSEINIALPWCEVKAAGYTYQPTFVQKLYRGSHDEWFNDFDNTKAMQAQVLARFHTSWLTLWGGGTITNLERYIFFREDANRSTQKVLPQQATGIHLIQSPEIRFAITFLKHWTITGRTVHTSVAENADKAFQFPEWFLHGQIAYQNILFQGNADVHIGIETHWQSAYYANGYDVPTQQFYTQQSFRNDDFLQLDAFLNLKMKRARLFFKYNNFVQLFTKQGYFPTPYYPGQPNILDFGFDWSFYD